MNIYYFSTASCGLCRMLKPKVQALDVHKQIQYVDAVENKQLADKFAVMQVPTIVVEDNNKVIYNKSRMDIHPDDLKQYLQKVDN